MRTIIFSIICLCLLSSSNFAKENDYNNGRIRIISSKGVKVTTDGGITWKIIPKTDIKGKNIRRIEPNGKQFYSDDYGVSWKEINKIDSDTVSTMSVKVFLSDKQLTLESENLKGDCALKIYSVYGEELYSNIINGNTFALDLSKNFPSLVIYTIERNGQVLHRDKIFTR